MYSHAGARYPTLKMTWLREKTDVVPRALYLDRFKPEPIFFSFSKQVNKICANSKSKPRLASNHKPVKKDPQASN